MSFNIPARPALTAMVLVSVATAAYALLSSYPGHAQDPGQAGPSPSSQMLAACRHLGAEAACGYVGDKGHVMKGVCRAPAGLPLACVSDRQPPPGGAGGGPPEDAANNTRTARHIAPAVSTQGVGCHAAFHGINATNQLPYRAAWSCRDGQRTLTGNGVPDHAVGVFPNPGNPNQMAAHEVQFSATLTPVLTASEGQRVKEPGYALNGIKFDPGTAQTCDETCTGKGYAQGGQWHIEALGQSYFDFGVDANNAHVQPGGSYHYHGVPTGLVDELSSSKGPSMVPVGWAADGFPMYARYGHDKPADASTPLRALRPSWHLRSSPVAGRPSTAIAPMGTFTQDYEYVAGSGDLDRCNGVVGVTPEFPKGAYFYLVTDSYPYVPRCVRGVAPPEHFGPPPVAPIHS